AGVVDREVDPAEFFDGRGDGRADCAAVGDIGDDGAGAPTGVPDQSGGLVQVVLVDRDQGDVGSGIGEGESGGAADADPSSRDEGDLVGEGCGGHVGFLSSAGPVQRVSMNCVVRSSAIAA